MRHSIGHRGRQISYFDASGPAAASAGVLLLLHAFPLSAEMWQPQLAAVPAGWRFVAPDLRGFGQSQPDDTAAPASIQDYADDLAGAARRPRRRIARSLPGCRWAATRRSRS